MALALAQGSREPVRDLLDVLPRHHVHGLQPRPRLPRVGKVRLGDKPEHERRRLRTLRPCSGFPPREDLGGWEVAGRPARPPYSAAATDVEREEPPVEGSGASEVTECRPVYERRPDLAPCLLVCLDPLSEGIESPAGPGCAPRVKSGLGSSLHAISVLVPAFPDKVGHGSLSRREPLSENAVQPILVGVGEPDLALLRVPVSLVDAEPEGGVAWSRRRARGGGGQPSRKRPMTGSSSPSSALGRTNERMR